MGEVIGGVTLVWPHRRANRPVGPRT